MRNIQTVRKVWYALFAINWLIILFYWLEGATGLWQSGSGALIAFGRIAGLAAAYMILLQFFLMGRMPWLEQAFGLDNLSRFHSKNGKMAFLFLILHPILIVSGYAFLGGMSFSAQFWLFVSSGWHLFFAFLGLILFILVVATSIYVARSRMKYEAWYFVHLLVYFAVFFSFFHQIEFGGSLLSSNLFYWYWIVLYVLVFAGHVAFRITRPILLFFKHKFVVSRIERESPSAVSIYISGNRLGGFEIKPGQFMIFRFLAKGMWWQAHPFSLSKMPDGKELRITVRELGDFTKEVKNLSVGTKILIEGPYGIFRDFFGMSDKALLIAGGIGITPIRSIMEDMLRKGKEVVLLYGNRREEDIVFKKEIEALQERYPAKVVHVLSSQENFSGEKGYIDEEKIRRLVPDFHSREIYLCGPIPMMDFVAQALSKLGIKRSQIHQERFSL